MSPLERMDTPPPEEIDKPHPEGMDTLPPEGGTPWGRGHSYRSAARCSRWGSRGGRTTLSDGGERGGPGGRKRGERKETHPRTERLGGPLYVCTALKRRERNICIRIIILNDITII